MAMDPAAPMNAAWKPWKKAICLAKAQGTVQDPKRVASFALAPNA